MERTEVRPKRWRSDSHKGFKSMKEISFTVLDFIQNSEGLLFESWSKSHNWTVTKAASLISDTVEAVGGEL